MSLIVDEHRELLSDQNRLDAFRRAIEELVKPGSVVVDLGAGSGIMGLLACRAGASRVYSIEETAMIELTREICRANGFEDRVTFIKDFSMHAHLPELADMVITDQIGQFGFGAGLFEYFRDARARFLKPGGVLIPSRIDLLVAPVQQEDLWRQVEFWNQSPTSFRFQPARKLAVNTGYPVKLQPQHLLASPAVLASLDTAQCPASISGVEASLEVENTGALHGIGGWFSAQLSPHVTMTNGPLGPNPIKRQNVFFPIERPVAVEKGDRVKVTMTIQPYETMVTWTVEVSGPQTIGGARNAITARFTHSTFQGMLLCQEDLRKTHPHFIPKLSPRGLARRSILDLSDGQRTLSEIEQEVYRRHPQLFPSLDQAAAFVAEVITRYSL